jgi:hypothetical protein
MKPVLVLLALIPLALAIPAPQANLKRQSEVDCGGDEYTQDEITAAANAACNYVQEGTTAGGSKFVFLLPPPFSAQLTHCLLRYPEVYNDYEGFSFNGVPGPYYEFPLMADGSVYDGGEPGADRVVINSDCTIAGEITHTGASGDDFVACSGTD